ncbi:hypothetical protein [Nocardia asteroides]|uniref:hypothetical protein n=1 Tax=Nocardia asteroides TaxID=1824 RepID=UPI001E2A7BB6|nr:hypothetical protein [Nocardia asteroides]UGT55182.1 hypothetical protein LTT85_32150 [Nocardia asteroides]
MSGFQLNVRRADDLLVLRIEFVNLRLDPEAAAEPRRLTRTVPATDADAIVIFHFPPQHIGEQVFAENDFHMFDANSKRLIAGESRLAFRVPAGIDSIPLTLVDLLRWDRFEPVLVQNEEPIILGANDYLADNIREPEPHHTAIELPFRVLLSTDSDSRWEHPTSAEAHDGYVSLWRTTLLPPRPGSSARVTAVWTPDLVQSFPASFPQSLDARNREEIVRISSLSYLRENLDALFMEHPGLAAETAQWEAELSRSIFAHDLALSALGGWARIHSKFNVPPIPQFLLSGEELLGLFGDTDLFSLEEWGHTIAMGRDLRAGTVARGYLFPFGHRANRISITRREFTSNGVSAPREGRLVQQSFITCEEPERSYPHAAGLPFTSIRILLDTTPDLGLTSSDVFVPTLDGAPFAFPIACTDHAGTVIQTTAAAVWVPEGDADMTTARQLYANINRVEFAQQPVTFTPRQARSFGPDNTTMTTVAVELRAAATTASRGEAGFLPEMVVAHVRVPALDQFALRTTRGPVKIAYHSKYTAAGGQLAPGGVFATLVGGVSVDVPASAAGGVVDSLGITLTGLSAEHGVVPNVDQLTGAAGAAGAAIEGLGGKLLGQFDLTDVIGPATKPAQLPTITTATRPGQRVVTLDWKPALKDPLPLPLTKTMAGPTPPALTINAILSQPDGSPVPPGTDLAPDTEITGTLTGVALEVRDVIRIEFTKINFHTKTGHKPEFSIDAGAVTFIGDLAFVNDLASLLRSAKGGPSVDVTPAGVSARLTLAVPEFGLGVFSLSNLAVSIGVHLYFSSRPLELEFALSSRQHPFLMSYALFGGGGHFSLSAKSDGTFDVEAAFEIGAAASINLVVAQGKAQVMLGVVFATRADAVELGGYLRIFGSLEILGLVTISVDFQLSLTYAAPNATARASLTVFVRVLGFSKSVTIAVQRSFNMSSLDLLDFTTRAGVGNHKTFREAVPLVECWIPYCDAFAMEGI